MVDIGGIAVFVAGATMLWLAYDTYWSGGLEAVKSKVNGHTYQVRSLPDRQAAADLLANIAAQLQTLVKHLEKTAAGDERTTRLVEKLDVGKISEGPESSKYTSYSINKGERIVFCLRSRDAATMNEIVDLNTMMFVALHELAHICTLEVGHIPVFWANFKWLLQESINVGVYQDRDYSRAPQAYCGIKITDSPLHAKA